MKQERIVISRPDRQMRMLAEAKKETSAPMSEIERRAVDRNCEKLRQSNRLPATTPLLQEYRTPAAEYQQQHPHRQHRTVLRPMLCYRRTL